MLRTLKTAHPGPRPKTCTECRRRHQKCKLRIDGPCSNCLRRFPRPECIPYLRESDRRSSPVNGHRQARAPLSEIEQAEIKDSLVLDAIGSPKPFAGVLEAVNTSNSVPVKPTPRNIELFNLFHQFVVPKLSSVDGTTSTGLYLKMIVPWMIQSPLMPNLTILVASFAQGLHQGLDANKCPETLAIKAKVLSLTNEFLARDFKEVGLDALLTVAHLASLEFIWGTKAALMSHMRGMKEMLRLRGGFTELNDPVLGWALIMIDYEIAIRFEAKLYLQPLELLALMPDTPPTISPPPALMSPLLVFPTTFVQVMKDLPLCKEAAEILDDVAFLSSMITGKDERKTAKIRSTATWLNERVSKISIPIDSSSSSDSDIILAVIRLTAIAYTSSISTLRPLSQTYTASNLATLYDLFSGFTPAGLKKWNAVPGILYWVLLTAVSSTRNEIPDRFLRCKVPSTRIVIGLSDFNLPTAYLRVFWGVQRWIEGEMDGGEVGNGVVGQIGQ